VETRTLVRAVIAFACIAATVLGLINTYGDDTEVKMLAERTACGSPNCSVSVLHEARSAFSQNFGFQTALTEKGKASKSASVDVECKRKQILIGEYECAVTSGGLPSASSSTR